MTTDFMNLRQSLGRHATVQQQKAADPRLSVWVGASAGTGKTKVLSDRVLRLLLDGVNAGKILCLTYTKAAAVEMNSRVAKRLSEWTVAPDAELEKQLYELFGYLPDNQADLDHLKARARRLFAILLDTPGGIKIQTIHSFCQEILRRFPLEAGISPYFEVMDDRNVKEAISQIQNRLIAEISLNPDSPLADAMGYLAGTFSELKFPEIISSIINNRGKIDRLINRFCGNRQKMLDAVAARLHIAPQSTPQDILQNFWQQIPKSELRTLLNGWQQSGVSFQKRAAVLAAALAGDYPENYSDYTSAFADSKGNPGKAAAKAVLAAQPQLEKILYDEFERCRRLTQDMTALRLFRSTAAVITLAEELINGYNRYKKLHAKMDYDDMILLTRNLLEIRDAARWVLFKLDGGIDNILIDEAQDTSPDQWAIIRAVSDEFFDGHGAGGPNRTIFAVGDRKQSIYSFQGADPDKFDEMQEYFAAKSDNFAKINLEVSFRSAPAVLDVVNSLFNNEDVCHGVASGEEKIVHTPFRQGDAGRVEFLELMEPEADENQEEWLPPVEHRELPSTSLRMAKKIAHRIKQMVSSGEFLQSKNRPLRYSDFLILVRKRDVFCEELIRECKNAGVNIAGMDRIKLLEQIAVQDLISLGKFLLLPDDDLSLAEVLKSPLFGLDDNDLFKLCYQRNNTLWQRLSNHPAYTQTAEILRQLLNLADFSRPFELYGYVLNQLRGKRKFAERMGYEAEDGLEEFMNLTLAFEQSHTPSLQKFINWIISDDVEIKRELEQSNNNVVRLMTVHGSKGLQAPIVILPDTTRIPQNKREAEMLWDEELFFYPAGKNDYDETCCRLKERQQQKTLEEYRRLLYVALTRAEDRMIICGYRKSRQPAEESWYSLLQKNIGKIAVYDEQKQQWEHVSPQLVDPGKTVAQADKGQCPPLPQWTEAPAAPELPLAKPLTPSKPDEDDTPVLSPLAPDFSSKLYQRGSIIHKLLQFLPEHTTKNAAETADRFIQNQAPEIDEPARRKMVSEVCGLLADPRFGTVFGPGSKAEVPLMGLVDDKIISAQIDRLIVEKDRVIIVDFKTNRPAAATPEQIPQIYRRQMASYRCLLQKIYPERQIITLILWTNTATLMEVD